MKRFYEQVTVGAPEDLAPGRHAVLLDGRPVRTPARHLLWVPSSPLARDIAAEWAAQEEAVELDTMPLTRVAAAAIDRIAPRRDAAIADLASIARSDQLCYRAEGPRDLADRQEEIWGPLVAWARATLGADLQVTVGVMPVGQPPRALAAFESALGQCCDHELAAVSLAAGAAGSLIVALALARFYIDAPAAIEAAILDEAFQAARWGEETEAVKRRRALAADLELATRFFALLGA